MLSVADEQHLDHNADILATDKTRTALESHQARLHKERLELIKIATAHQGETE